MDWSERYEAGAVNPAGCDDIVTHVGSILDDKEGTGLGDASQATKVDVAAVHDVECTGLNGQLVEPADIAVSRWRDVQKRGDRAAQIKSGMELYRRVGSGPVGSRAKCETQIDNRGVHGDDRHVEIKRIGFDKIQRPNLGHEFTGQMLPRSPVALFIGTGQSTLGDPGAGAHMISQSGLRCSNRPQYPADSPEKASAQNPASKNGPTQKGRHCAGPAHRTRYMHAETPSAECAP